MHGMVRFRLSWPPAIATASTKLASLSENPVDTEPINALHRCSMQLQTLISQKRKAITTIRQSSVTGRKSITSVVEEERAVVEA
jgi:hypothetical protein